VRRFERRFEEAYRLDPERCAEALTPRTRLVVVTNLHNPSGASCAVSDLQALGEQARSVGAHVLVDEVYLDAAEDGAGASVASLGPPFIVTSSLTKAYGLAGLRCGWVVGTEDVIARVRLARDVVDGNGAFPAEALSVVAFDHLESLRRRCRALVSANLALVRAFLETRADLSWVAPAGGTVCFPKIEGLVDAGPLVERLLERYETAVVPGAFFGSPRHFRLGFGGERASLEKGLAAVGAALDEIASPGAGSAGRERSRRLAR
jgi:hypothetical protein